MPDARKRPVRFASFCSGIEAASAAWLPLGWECAAVAEIDPFACAVLAHHYPDVPNFGDITKIKGADLPAGIDIFIAGTPCQSFSLAGLRKGLADERGNLAFEYIRIANEYEQHYNTAVIVIWENVPGVLSDDGNAFGCFVAALAGNAFEAEPGPRPQMGKNSKFWRWDRERKRHVPKWPAAGWVAGSERAAAWRVLDAQYFGLAQRRRRVFVVAGAGDRIDPGKVLFESGGLRRDFAPRRKAGQGIAGTLGASLARSRGAGTNPGAITSPWNGGPHPSLSQSHSTGGIGMSNQELFSQNGAGLVSYVPEMVAQAISCKWSKGTSGPVGDEHHNLVAIPFDTMQISSPDNGSNPKPGSPCHTLNSNAHVPAVALVASVPRVRRLMPVECERLQGFYDGYTQIAWRGKAPEDCPDGSRYKAIGNSKAVPVVAWIGKRIEAEILLNEITQK